MGLSQTRVIPNVLGCSAPHLAFPRFCRLPKNGCGITSVYHLASPPHRPTQSTKFRTRWLESHPSARNFSPPHFMRQSSKTSVSSNSHASSLQNERFVRDLLQKVMRPVSKTSVSYETSSKSQAETPIGAHTSSSRAKQFRDSSPPTKRPLTRQSHCHGDMHQLATSRLPAPATKLFVFTRLTRTKYCACHEI